MNDGVVHKHIKKEVSFYTAGKYSLDLWDYLTACLLAIPFCWFFFQPIISKAERNWVAIGISLILLLPLFIFNKEYYEVGSKIPKFDAVLYKILYGFIKAVKVVFISVLGLWIIYSLINNPSDKMNIVVFLLICILISVWARKNNRL